MSGDEASGGPPYWGKFRGKVIDNVDPLQMGRVMASVPQVHRGLPTGWALPCLPFAGTSMGFYGLPAIGANVWIEYENGNPDRPIWAGCFPAPTDVPPLAQPLFLKVMIQTLLGQSVMLDDTPGIGGITLRTLTGEMLMMNSLGITIQDTAGNMIQISPAGIILKAAAGASIALTGPAVSINNGALGVI
jgi:hypothetical protein